MTVTPSVYACDEDIALRASADFAILCPKDQCLAYGTDGAFNRRKGQAAGIGQPASPPVGVSGVEFTALTLGPQIVRASYDLNRRYGIDDLIAGRRSCDLFDPQEVREATVLTVLYRQYLEMSRGPQEKADTFAAKSSLYRQELDDLLARTVVHWAPRPGVVVPSRETTRFSTRITR